MDRESHMRQTTCLWNQSRKPQKKIRLEDPGTDVTKCQQGPGLGRFSNHIHMQLTWSNKGGPHGGGGEKETAWRNVVEKKWKLTALKT